MAFAENTSVAVDVTTDAAFRTWVAAVRQAILDAGLTRTSDTGQIDTATVSAPALSAYAGYDIFQFTDSEQSGDPIVFKLEYGKGSSSHTRHALRCTAGTGSDGSGGITNAQGTTTDAAHSGNGSGNGYIMASFFDGAFVLEDTNTTSGSQQNHAILHVERVRDKAGTIITGMIYAGAYVNTPTGYLRLNGVWVSANPRTASPGGTVSGAALFGAVRITNSQAYPAQLHGILLCTSSVSGGDSGSVSIRGASKTYKRPNHTSTFSNDSTQGYCLYRSA